MSENSANAGAKFVADDPRLKQIFDVTREAKSVTGQVLGVLGDLAPKARALREQGEVLEGKLRDLMGLPRLADNMDYHKDRRHFSVFSFKACDEAFRDNGLFSSAAYRASPGVQSLGRTILEMTGDEHRRYRAVAQPMFIRPKVMNWWKEKWINEAVDSLLDRLQGQNAVDLNLELCARLPMYVVTRGIGMNGDDALTFRENLLRGASYHLSMEERIESQKIVAKMLKELVVQRRNAPQDDVISGLINNDFKQADGSSRKLTDDEVFSYCRLIMFAGGGTTWRQLGITLYALLTEHRNWDECREDRKLLESAVNEAVRWCPTVSTFQRLVTRDTQLVGVPIPAESIVDISLSSANRDPARWQDPDRYDIHRPEQTHIGFSIGPHQCLGMHVARQEMIVALNGLMDRFPRMRLDPGAPPPELVGGLEQRGVTAVPVLLQ